MVDVVTNNLSVRASVVFFNGGEENNNKKIQHIKQEKKIRRTSLNKI